QPGRLQIQRDQLLQAGFQLENMAGLAAGGAAGVQYPEAGSEFQQGGRQLGRLVLNADRALGKARQLVYVPRCGQGDAVGAETAGAGLNTLVVQARKVGVTLPLQPVDPQGHWRMEIDRKSTRLYSSHVKISYAVFCL